MTYIRKPNVINVPVHSQQSLYKQRTVVISTKHFRYSFAFSVHNLQVIFMTIEQYSTLIDLINIRVQLLNIIIVRFVSQSMIYGAIKKLKLINTSLLPLTIFYQSTNACVDIYFYIFICLFTFSAGASGLLKCSSIGDLTRSCGNYGGYQSRQSSIGKFWRDFFYATPSVNHSYIHIYIYIYIVYTCSITKYTSI